MTWDKYFHGICKEVSKNSKCLSRQIGAILVKDKSIVSTGYNGPPRGVMTCTERYTRDPKLIKTVSDVCNARDGVGQCTDVDTNICPRYTLGFKSGEGLDWCVAGHAERNTLINAARNGIATKGTSMYMDCGIPCTPCLVEIINAGVNEITVTKHEFYDISAEYLLKNSNLICRVYEHLK